LSPSDPPSFSLQEDEAGWVFQSTHRAKFRCTSVEECCEWAIAVREAISVAAGKAPFPQ